MGVCLPPIRKTWIGGHRGSRGGRSIREIDQSGIGIVVSQPCFLNENSWFGSIDAQHHSTMFSNISNRGSLYWKIGKEYEKKAFSLGSDALRRSYSSYKEFLCSLPKLVLEIGKPKGDLKSYGKD